MYFREHPVTGPAGHSYISSEPRATSTSPGALVNLTVVDHIDASVREVVDYTREVAPDAEPLPKRVQDVYQWVVENTATASEAIQQRRDTIVYRQSLEHAIAMGDTKVIPPHRCPRCRTFGLMWQRPIQRAACTNVRCLTPDGMSSTWTLAKLAFEHVDAAKNHGQACAT